MPVAGIMGRRNVKRRNSVRRDGGLKNVARPTPIGIVSTTQAGDDVTIVFNQPVSLNGIPQFLKNGTIPPTAASLSAPNTLVLTYPTAGPIATNVAIPAEEPAVRNSSGGFVSPTTVTV